MAEQPLLLAHALLLPAADAAPVPDGAVVVRDGRIVELGRAADVLPRHAGLAPVELHGRLLLPGLVNAHLHPELHLLKGLLEDLELRAWTAHPLLGPALALLDSPEGRALQRAGTRAALADCALGGATTIGAYGVTEGAHETAAAALRELGLRGSVTLRDAAFRPAAEGAAWRAYPHVYRLHAEEALTPQELAAAAAAHARGERIVIHVAETAWRVELARRTFGTTTIRLLARHGLLSPRVLLSHAVHVDDEEIDLIAEAGAPVLASPAAEMKLADGVAPVAPMLRRGVTLGLGTDAAVCNNSNDIFLEMRQLGLVQKLRYGAGVLPAPEILRAATAGGAAALGLEGGELSAGAPADIAVLALDGPRMRPLDARPRGGNVVTNVVYAATAQDVTEVLVGGRWIVRGGRLLTTDADALWDELDDAARVLRERLIEDG